MRRAIELSDGWTVKGPGETVEQVRVPHTWNAHDGQDGGNDYWRGARIYGRAFDTPEFDAQAERVFLEFEGVNATADVSVNGRRCAHHDGGYATFRAEVTRLLRPAGERNELEVRADNAPNESVYPQRADFTFYGGIYRPVRLMVVPACRFSLQREGGPGFAVTPAHEGDFTKVRVQSWLEGNGAGRCLVRVRAIDADGAVVAVGEGEDCLLTIDEPHLWDGVRDPYLYRIELELLERRECGPMVIDAVCGRFGIRTIHVDANEGFHLNGRPYPLRGVSRHQDRRGVGNALTSAMHREDIALMREMGANTVRLAHYQHAQEFYDLCDEAGLVAWAEIPYISEHLPAGDANAESQLHELVEQCRNHPSVCVWGISNEITISTKDRAAMLAAHRRLNDLAHALDPTRPTTIACYAMCSHFNRTAHITDLVAWNLYLGWYVPGLFLNKAWFAFWRLLYRERPIGLSEYGCEGMPNLHSSRPRRGDHTEEYQAIYHEYMLRFFEARPYLWCTYVWNMFDFAADARDQGGEPGMNHKGLVTFDRATRKDAFYLYKAYWSDEPFVHLCSKRYERRAEKRTLIKVYSNQPQVELLVNGERVAQKRGKHVFAFRAELDEGPNDIEVRAGGCADGCTVERVRSPDPAYRLCRRTGSAKSNWV